MKITLPHWASILVTVVGVVLEGLPHVPALSAYAAPLTAAGGFLIAGGLSGALVLPTIKSTP